MNTNHTNEGRTISVRAVFTIANPGNVCFSFHKYPHWLSGQRKNYKIHSKLPQNNVCLGFKEEALLIILVFFFPFKISSSCEISTKIRLF